MPKYIALLRAINVGGHLVKMDRLRTLFEAMNLENVETFIASGNVIFDSRTNNSAALATKIEKQLHAALGYPVATFLRNTEELRSIAGYEPFGNAAAAPDVHAVYVGFMASEPDPTSQAKLLSCNSKHEEFHVSGREVYWLSRASFSESKFSGAQLEKVLGRAVTLRNSTTVRKLAAKYK